MLRVVSRRFSSKKIAVVLSGSGVYDGTEITESVSVLIHLSRHNVLYQCYAPTRPQFHVINHLSGEAMEGQERNILEESARIARGKVSSLSELNTEEYDGLVMPGGFGAAKNLSSFGPKGDAMTVDSDLLEKIEQFYQKQKPIASCCISPIILAKVLGTQSGHKGVTLTLGKADGPEWPYGGSLAVAEKFGNKVVEKDVNEVQIDYEARIVTSPAYMKDTATPAQVYTGIGLMIDEFLKLIK